ncbi:MAG: hypothetical protein ACI82I_002110, partial [Gammaproteobacteria bacterium]
SVCNGIYANFGCAPRLDLASFLKAKLLVGFNHGFSF